jgi:putative aminopeptidase FrvX
MIELIKQLVEIDAPSGGEAKLADFIATQARPHADEVRLDLMGNLLIRKPGTGARLLIACRMDEPGFCITHVDQKGFLRFGPVGEIPPADALGARVRLSSGAVGVIREEKREPKTEPSYDRMFIDLGARDGEEARRFAKVGDLACFAGKLQEGEGVLIGKAVALRALCAALLSVLKAFPETPNDVTFALTVQGELSGRGAVVAAYNLNPTLAMVLEACETDDLPGTKGPSLSLRGGPAIRVKDSQIVTSPKVREVLMDLASAEKIPYQLEVSLAPALNARTIQSSSGGTLTGVLCLPVRYLRTNQEVIVWQDVEQLVSLLRGLLCLDLREKGF